MLAGGERARRRGPVGGASQIWLNVLFAASSTRATVNATSVPSGLTLGGPACTMLPMIREAMARWRLGSVGRSSLMTFDRIPGA